MKNRDVDAGVARSINAAFSNQKVCAALWKYADDCLKKAADDNESRGMRIHGFAEGLAVVMGPLAGEVLFDACLRNDLRKLSAIIDAGIDGDAETEVRLFFLEFGPRMELHVNAERLRDAQVSVEASEGHTDYILSLANVSGAELRTRLNHRFAVRLISKLLSEMLDAEELPPGIGPENLKALKEAQD